MSKLCESRSYDWFNESHLQFIQTNADKSEFEKHVVWPKMANHHPSKDEKQKLKEPLIESF